MPFSRLIKAAFGLVALVAMSTAAMSTGAIAQTAPAWPQKPIKVIVNFGPGGSADNSMRPFAEKVSRGLGQQVVIENKGGASGALGLEAAARSAPDGYTFVVTPALSVAILPHLRKLPLDVFKDLAPVTQFTDGTLLFAVHPSVPANNLREFVAYAKANPGKLSWGTAGVGSHGHVTAEYFKLITGTDILHVPYRGGGEALADFLAGVVQIHADPNTLPSVSAGKAKLLGVIDAERHPSFPDVPMVKEVYPEIDYVAWFGMLAPAGTPKPIIDRMAAEMNKVAREPDMKPFLLRFALRPNAGTPEEMATLLRNDYDRYGKLIKQINMKAE
jgi:tripartite-type tricarboxylate transporter receptor subunit TctC